MPSVNLSRKVVESVVGKKLSTDKLKDRISMLGTDLEGIEGDVISVEIFPNRPDMLSEQGFGRALSSFLGVKTGLRDYKINTSNDEVIIEKSVKSVRPYTACAVVKGLKFSDESVREIIQAQEKLHMTYGRNRKKIAIGIYPLEKIKFPITYCAKDPLKISFVPLEGSKSMNGKQILEKHPTGKAYAHLLEGMKKYPFFMDADGKVLSMPPVINSEEIGRVGAGCTDVFVECSGYDYDSLNKCLNILVTMLADMGGKIFSLKLKYSDGVKRTPDLKAWGMKVDLGYVNSRLGLDLKEADMKKYLGRMGYGYVGKRVLVPAYRTDVLHQVDLIEDIAIAYGYENFEEQIPNVATVGKESNIAVFKDKVANLLVGLGLMEVSTYTITDHQQQTVLMDTKVQVIKLANSLTEEYNCLRAWVVPSLMDVLRGNRHNEYPQQIFDIGRVFKKGGNDTGVVENDRLGVAICKDGVDFTQIKQVLHYIMKSFGIEYSVEEVEHDSFVPGRVGRVVVNDKKVAYIGEIHPSVLQKWQMEMPVAVLELNLTELFEIIF